MSLPSVTIAMAVYKPNIKWFIEQLESLNRQDYQGKMDLLVWNDSPIDFVCDSYLEKYITVMPFKVIANGKNNGVTFAFEQLTIAATSDYISYCDQDDIWMSDKISKTVDILMNNKLCSACHSNVELIDGSSIKIKDTIYPTALEYINEQEYQKRIILLSNWLLGCAMIFPIKLAKDAIPFPRMVYHDQWLCLFAAFQGPIIFLNDKLLLHRIHDDNNSMILQGIHSKSDYYNKKLNKDYDFINYVNNRLICNGIYKNEIEWVNARYAYKNTISFQTLKGLLLTLKIKWKISVFEILLPFIPEFIFTDVLSLIRKFSKYI